MWVLTITDTRGLYAPLTEIYDSEDAAQDGLTEYVKRNWVYEMDGSYYDAVDAVREYFDETFETYCITQTQ